jgi:acyl-CoA thioester hydrolase
VSDRAAPGTRAQYRVFRTLTTRWLDNDAYGHVNNVNYYSFFDTAVSGYLVEGGFIDIARSEVIGLAVESQCRYFAPVAFPDLLTAGLRVGRRGRTSVRYEVGLFRNGEETASAEGYFVHVYVDRATSRPVLLPDTLVTLLAPLEA